ncbi:MAG: sigma-70 family RNA polymerase sigma factor [Bacteroidota bacterium]
MSLSKKKHQEVTFDLITPQGFRQVFEEYGPFVFSVCSHYLKDDAECNDITSKIFLSIWERRSSLKINGSLKSYLYRSAKLQVFDHFKLEERRRQRFKTTVHDLGLFDTVVENEVWYNDFSEQLQIAIKKLPHQRKEVFQMAKLEGYSVKQISERLFISTNTVKTHLTKATAQLKRELSDFLIPISSTGS